MEGTNLLITRETDYALRILRVLADGEQLTSGEICRKELLPQQFVYKILKKLERAGMITITRGAEGGCRLATDLKRLSLYDLTEVMDTEKNISACTKPGFECVWRQQNASKCIVHGNLSKIQRVLDNELKSYSLHQMLFDEK